MLKQFRKIVKKFLPFLIEFTNLNEFRNAFLVFQTTTSEVQYDVKILIQNFYQKFESIGKDVF